MRARRDDVRERGQATPLLLAVVALTVVMMVAAGRFGGRVVQREGAQVAADAAALAGVSGGKPAAASIAAANGGVLERYVEEAWDPVTSVRLTVLVVVRVGEMRATARATRAP